MSKDNTWTARLGGILFVGGPPAVVLGIAPGFFTQHPVIAVIVVISYETVLLVFSFASRVFRELEKRWLQDLVEFLDQMFRRTFSRFGRRYREFVLNSLRYIDVKGLATIGYYTPELDDVFVDVSLALRAPSQVGTGLLAALPPEVTDRQPIENFLDKPDAVVVAVVGVPGSGKTTLLRHVARGVYNSRGRRVRTIPILLYLRDHIAAISNNPAVTVSELLSGMLGPLQLHEPPGWFRQQLRRGHCVVLLDGLDEVARQEDRRAVADWVERVTRDFPRNDYVVTSRPRGYQETPIQGATVLQVRPFTEEQVAKFVVGWYRAVEKHSTKATDSELQLIAQPLADDLLERLRGAVSLYDLTVNPLLLTMIANVHRYRGALPGSRTDLYSEICQVMLWRRREAKRLVAEMRGEKKELLLRGLAFAMMQRRVRDLTMADMLVELAPALLRTGQGVTAEDFIADVSSNGLLVERESGKYSFAHLTFQEYLAATHIRDKGLTDVLIAAVDDVWWQETTLLYAARSDADPIVRACLASTSVTAMLLAFDCADQASEVAPELRVQLDLLLDSALVAGVDAERRRLMAGVLVARHLRQLVAIEDGGRVCVAPITTALYWLFLQDSPQYVPDAIAPIEPSTQVAVTGVRGSDALAFAAWANDLTRGEVTFRLPTHQEATAPAVQRVLDQAAPTKMCLWLAPEEASAESVPLIPPRASGVHQVLTTQLTHHVVADITAVPSTLAKLLLLRTVAVSRLLAAALKINRNPDMAANRYLIHDLSLSRILTGALNQHDETVSLRLAHDLTARLDLTTAYTRDLVPAHRGDLPLTSETLEDLLESTVSADIDLGPETSLERALSIDLGQVLNRKPRLPNNWGDTEDDEWTPHETERLLDRTMGAALSRSVATTLRNATVNGAWSMDFAHVFLDAVQLGREPYTVSPDALLYSFGSSYYPKVRRLGSGDQPSWQMAVATGLEQNALAVARRERLLTPQIASEVRLSALCLAVEADYQRDREFAFLLRRIAATITLIERRINGSAIAPEGILLATA